LRDCGINTYAGWFGCAAVEIVGQEGIKKEDVIPYLYPTDEKIRKAGVTGLFLGYYLGWGSNETIRDWYSTWFLC